MIDDPVELEAQMRRWDATARVCTLVGGLLVAVGCVSLILGWRWVTVGTAIAAMASLVTAAVSLHLEDRYSSRLRQARL